MRPVAAARDEKLTEPAAAPDPDADADPDTEPDTEPEAEAEAAAWMAYSTATCGVDSDK